MKKAFIISLLSLATASAYAQVNENSNTPPRIDEGINLQMPPERLIALDSQTIFVDTQLSLAPMPGLGTGATCRKSAGTPKRAVPAWPSKTDYTSLTEPSCAPCYKYTTRNGLKVMECPFLLLPPQGGTPVTINETSTAAGFTLRHKAYTGNYPSCRRDPDMPKRAKVAWPKAAYTPIGDPKCAPCYQYTTKRGLKVMECPNLWFPPQP
jgi:hypothetical protein